MADLYLHGGAVETVFELLGVAENDITFSLGWTLRQSPSLASILLEDVVPGSPALTVSGIRLQEYAADHGVTDIEIEADDVNVIIEAKRGWTLPTEAQLRQYADRKPHMIVVLSECSKEYARPRLARRIGGVEVTHRSWRDIAKLVRKSIQVGRRAERHALDEFLTYLETAMPVQDLESNLVYVVSLSSEFPNNSTISWIDIVEKKHCYFHPVGGSGWPKQPPNYLGFRYAGRLQAIRHVDEYEVGTNPHKVIAEMESVEWPCDHFFYKLGPAMKPTREVRMGEVWPSGRVWAALDLLLTCKTVSEARDKTNERRERWAG